MKKINLQTMQEASKLRYGWKPAMKLGEIKPKRSEKRLFQKALEEEVRTPLVRPPTKYDNETAEEKINKLLTPEV